MKLFEPVKLGTLELSNRTVMAPMTRSMSPNGMPGEDVAGYYERRALGGVGLIITEGLEIDHPGAVHDAAVPHFYTPQTLAVWARTAKRVQTAGAALVPQLWHVGGYPDKASCSPERQVSPSGVYKPGSVFGAPATQREIDDVIEAYAKAAAAALAIGCDGIELHGAHGYLLDQFFWAETNRRSDGYGGDVAARTRFACEVVAACRRATRPDFPIFLRFSQWKLQDYGARLCESPADLERFLTPLVDAGVDLFDCSTRRFWIPEFDGSEMNLAGWTQKLSGRPAMTVGSVGLENDVVNALHEGSNSGFSSNLNLLEIMLERGDFELVGIGRALISDASWVDKVRRGAFAELRGFNKADLLTLS